MEREEIFSRLNEILEEVLELTDKPNLTDVSSADDFEEWDSLSQVQLVATIQKSFGIKFTAQEMLSWDNVGQMVDTIQKKL